MIQSNESEEYEFILGQNAQKEYYVKIVGEPYCRCKFVSKEQLQSSPNGEELIARYMHSTNHKTSPPYYNEEYDIPDHIIQKKDNLFLVKWTHLNYDQLTWEKKVDKNLLTLFRSRKATQFPKLTLTSTNIIFKDSLFPIKKFQLYRDLNISLDIVEEIQYLFYVIQENDATISEIGDNRRSIISIAGFIHNLLRKANDCGPFLIIVDQKEYNEWYDFLNQSREITTLAYNGSDQSREIIRNTDFINDENSSLHFHVLLTNPAILAKDINYMQKIEWRYAVVHNLNDMKFNSSVLKNLEKLKILRKIVFQPVDQKSIIPNAQSISTAFDSPILKESIDAKKYEDFMQFMQKAKISPSLKIESTYLYIVECPMNDFQKLICRYLLFENLSGHAIEKSNFFSIARLFYYVMQHPFIIPGIECRMQQKNVLLASTKIRVMRRILYEIQGEIEENGNSQNILICTQIPEIFQIINDYIDETYPEEDNIKAYLEFELKQSKSSGSNLNKDDQTPFKMINILIIYDGKLTDWEKLLSSRINQSTRVYKLECLESREIEIKSTPSPTDEEICKIITFQIMTPSGEISPRLLLEENISFDMFQNDLHSSSFAANTFTGDDFWANIVKTVDFISFGKILETSSKPDQNQQISLYKRRQFVRSFISFGWDNWSNFIDSIGFSLNEEQCKKLCLAILLLIKHEKEKTKYKRDKNGRYMSNSSNINHDVNCVSLLYRDYLLNIKVDNNNQFPKNSNLNPNTFKDQLRNDQFLLTQELPADFFERILQFACLNYFFTSSLYNSDDMNSLDFSLTENPKSESWWTNEHDKALLFAIHKYGFGNYIPFLINENIDDESSLKRLFPVDNYKRSLIEIASSNVSIDLLDQRETELLSFITCYMMNDLRKKNNDLSSLVPGWTHREQQIVISYILLHGFNINSVKEMNSIASKFVCFCEHKENDENQNESISISENNNDENEAEKSNENENIKENEEINNEEGDVQSSLDNEDESRSENDQNDVFRSYQLPHQTKESVINFLQIIKKEIGKPNPNGGLSYIVSLRLRIRIISMKFLHQYVAHVSNDNLYFFYAHVPKWKIGNYFISVELEHLFICEIEKRGFGEMNSILSLPAFSAITDRHTLNYMKNEYKVIQRIYLLWQISTKKDLFAHEPAIGDSEFEKLFGISLPISVSPSCIIHNFGKIIPNNPNFHSERYIYPVGFKTSRFSPSLHNSSVKVRWFSEILEADNAPLFRVWQEGIPETYFEGPTTTSAWVKALRASKHDNKVSISGPDSFLLTNSIVTYFVQKLPGASACKNYNMRNVNNDPAVVQFLKTNALASSNDDGSES